jgi:hypothetical protein
LAKPEATPIIFCSAIPTLMNLSGNVFLNLASPEESPKSPETIINLGFFSPAESAA